MPKQEPLSEALVLESLQVGSNPLIEALLQRLRLREFLQQVFSPLDPRIKLPAVDSALVLVRNFTLCRHPLYEVPQWVRGIVPTLTPPAHMIYGRKIRLDLGERSFLRWRFDQPLWEIGDFEDFRHPFGIFLRNFLRLGKDFAHLDNIDLGETFGKTCFAV